MIIGDYFFCAITIDKDGAAKQIRGDLYGVKKTRLVSIEATAGENESNWAL